MTGARRSTAQTSDAVLNYAEIGATQTEEVLRYPPRGFRPFQSSHRLGSGPDRFDAATRALMTWGIHRNSGIPVVDIARESDADRRYRGVEYGRGGGPVAPQTAPTEQLYGPDGTPYVTAGTTAVQQLRVGPLRIAAPVKVVYVVQEPNRVGFAYGSRHGHPIQVEQFMFVEREPDDAVWLTIRSISKADRWVWRGPLAVFRLRQRSYTRRFVTALHPARSS